MKLRIVLLVALAGCGKDRDAPRGDVRGDVPREASSAIDCDRFETRLASLEFPATHAFVELCRKGVLKRSTYDCAFSSQDLATFLGCGHPDPDAAPAAAQQADAAIDAGTTAEPGPPGARRVEDMIPRDVLATAATSEAQLTVRYGGTDHDAPLSLVRRTGPRGVTLDSYRANGPSESRVYAPDAPYALDAYDYRSVPDDVASRERVHFSRSRVVLTTGGKTTALPDQPSEDTAACALIQLALERAQVGDTLWCQRFSGPARADVRITFELLARASDGWDVRTNAYGTEQRVRIARDGMPMSVTLDGVTQARAPASPTP